MNGCYFRVSRLCAVLLPAVLLGACVVSAPVQEMSDARQAISAATNIDEAGLAATELDLARNLLEQAELHIRNKEFSSARRDAVASRAKAVEARQIAEGRSAAELEPLL